MENTVILSLKDYEEIKEERAQALNDRDKWKASVESLLTLISKMKEAIMKENLMTYKFKEYSLEELTNPDSLEFGFINKSEMEAVGITTKEMIDYLKKRYEEVKNNE